MIAPYGHSSQASLCLRLNPEQRRTLQTLASSGPSDLTEAIMLAHGFSSALLDYIARAGLAVVALGTVRAGGCTSPDRGARSARTKRKLSEALVR